MSQSREPLDLKQAQDQLLDLRKTLLDRVRRLDKDVHHREEPLPADFAEQAVELENREVMEALDDDARYELRQIERALKRIQEGEYESCRTCSEAIGSARLRAIPWATLCIRCAAEEEQAQAR